mgnify:CR=1 FL=1
MRFKKNYIFCPLLPLSPKIKAKIFLEESKFLVGLLPSQRIKKLITQQLKKYLNYRMMVVLDTKSTKLKTLVTTFLDTRNSSRSGCWTHMSTLRDIEENGNQAPHQLRKSLCRKDFLEIKLKKHNRFPLLRSKFLQLQDQLKKKKARQQMVSRHQRVKNKIYLIYLVIE